MTTKEDRDSDVALKARMRRRLGEIRWNLEDLAQESGESYSNIRNWVTGGTRVPAAFLTRYAQVVPVNPTWLLTGRGASEPIEGDLPDTVFGLLSTVLRLASDPRVRRADLRARLETAIGLLNAPAPDGSSTPEGPDRRTGM